MHRHAYQGRKLSLERDQRRALIRGQVTSLVLREQIETTLPKAKEIAPHFERMVTKAKAGSLHAQRQLRSTLLTENAVQKLIQELVPAFADRQGGYTRIVKTGFRRGDNAAMAVVALVLPDKPAKTEKAAKASTDKSAKDQTRSTAPEAASAAASANDSASRTAKHGGEDLVSEAAAERTKNAPKANKPTIRRTGNK